MRSLSSLPPFICDTDFLSSFLWAKRLDILLSLYEDQIFVPDVVVSELGELKRTQYIWVPRQLDVAINSKKITTYNILPKNPEGQEYLKLVNGVGVSKPIGKGEAAVLSFAKVYGGTVASNNLADVNNYCHKNGIGLISTDDVLCLAYINSIIDEVEGESIWNLMKSKRRRLPVYDFSECLRRFQNGDPK